MKRLSPLKQYLYGFSFLLGSLMLSAIIVLYVSTKPYREAKAVTIDVAQSTTDLTSFGKFTIYNGLETYYSIFGENSSGKKEIVSLNPDTNKVYVTKVSSGITEKKAARIARENGAEKISTITFGRYQDQTIWEVTAHNGFYLVDFNTGRFLERKGI